MPAAETAGLRSVRELMSGAEPVSPMAELLGTTIAAAGPGTVTLRSSPGPAAYSRRGSVHGGALCTFLDTALVLAAVTTCERVELYSTVDLAVHFLRPVPPGDQTLTTHAEVLKSGSRLTFAQARVETADGTVLATATGSVVVG